MRFGMLTIYHCGRARYYATKSPDFSREKDIDAERILRRLDKRRWRDLTRTADGPKKATLYACMSLRSFSHSALWLISRQGVLKRHWEEPMKVALTLDIDKLGMIWLTCSVRMDPHPRILHHHGGIPLLQ